MLSQKTTLTRDIKLLLVFSAMRNVTDLFLGTFLISFIMHISPSQIVSVGMYRLFEYAALLVGTLAIANLCKRYSKTFVFALNELPKSHCWSRWYCWAIMRLNISYHWGCCMVLAKRCITCRCLRWFLKRRMIKH